MTTTLALFVVVRFFYVLRNEHAGLSVLKFKNCRELIGNIPLSRTNCNRSRLRNGNHMPHGMHAIVAPLLFLTSIPLLLSHIIWPKIFGLQIYLPQVETRLVVQNLFFSQSNICVVLRQLFVHETSRLPH